MEAKEPSAGLEETGERRPLRFPSDAFPLAVLAGVIACYLVYFLGAVDPDRLAALALQQREGGKTLSMDAAAYDLKVCNRADEGSVFVAVAYFDARFDDWIARGWYPQSPTKCRDTMRNLSPPIYVYGETRNGDVSWQGSGEKREFCIDPEKPFIYLQSDCGRFENARYQSFGRLSLSGEGGEHVWTIEPRRKP